MMKLHWIKQKNKVKIFRLLFFSLVILFLLVTAISLFIPSRVRISKAIDIAAACPEVWQPIEDMRRWAEWNPFLSQDSQGDVRYSGNPGDIPSAMDLNGTSIRWKENAADNRTAVMQKGQGRSIGTGWQCISQSADGPVTLQWYMDFELRWYPWEKFASILFEKSYGLRMDAGLRNLKKLVEQDRRSIP